MKRSVNDAQLSTLRWIAQGMPGEATNAAKLSARALETRGLAKVRGRGPTWRAELTADGRYCLDHGRYLDTSPPADVEKAAPPGRPKKDGSTRSRQPEPPPLLDVDSPRGMRESGRRPKGDDLFDERNPDPFDERVLISVKEAAWLLSLTEDAIRRAAVAGDVDRVYIGDGATRYRIVYGSLLAWVNGMPRESAHRLWWE